MNICKEAKSYYVEMTLEMTQEKSFMHTVTSGSTTPAAIAQNVERIKITRFHPVA